MYTAGVASWVCTSGMQMSDMSPFHYFTDTCRVCAAAMARDGSWSSTGKHREVQLLFGGGSNSLVQRLRDFPFFIRRLLRELMDPQRSLPLVFRAQMIFAMVLSGLYALSPVDILPEGVLGLVGLLDDILILLIVFLHTATIYRSFLLHRHGGY